MYGSTLTDCLYVMPAAEIAVELYDHEGDDGKKFGGDEEATNLGGYTKNLQLLVMFGSIKLRHALHAS